MSVLLAGLGFGAALPIMMALAAEIGAPERKAFTGAVMFSGMPAGGGSSALLVQYLGGDFDWQTLFLIGGLLPLLIVPAIYFLLPETRSRNTVKHGFKSRATSRTRCSRKAGSRQHHCSGRPFCRR